ncbi:uncharacterized protein LOC131241259 isoform X2 [Magnolia sinica]|uniref:uncharacterized protein LOC131241259 isoform X2 n=1 Tax=Magnolia sinica TaxID=86752 RepID=UPI0026583101|nr:uncharacterized protein LOC131241259 isoform X2 [Magnolia sinica]
MGSLETGVFMKRTPLLRSSLSSGRGDRHHSFFHRPRSRFARFLLFEKVDYLQWICTVAIFFFVVVLFQAFLPGSVMEKSGGSVRELGLVSRDLVFFKGMDGLDFGEGIRFEPSKLLEKFRRDANSSMRSSGRLGVRAAVRKPQLALVVADLSIDAAQLLMTSIAVPLQEIGYSIQVYSLEDGPAHAVWRNIGLSATILAISNKSEIAIDWLNYDGVLVNSLKARDVMLCLLQEPFKSLPVIWMIYERTLAVRLRQYTLDGQSQLINDWRRAFNRATVVVFPNFALPMMYATFDAGNYFVIPGSPDEAWEAQYIMDLHHGHDPQADIGYRSEDFVIAIVGSQFSYSGLWLEHALVLQALAPILAETSSDNQLDSHLKVGILSGNSNSTYNVALEAIALKLGYSRGSVHHIGVDGDVANFLRIADLVIYGSFLEEQSFPPLLIQAMCFGKPVIAPDLAMIRKYIDDRVNGFVFPKENMNVLTQILFQAISKGKLSPLARNIALIGKGHAKNLMVSEAVEGYAWLLEKVLKLPSEVASPRSVAEIPMRLKEEWQWHLFEEIAVTEYPNRTFRSNIFLDQIEESWNSSHMEGSRNLTSTVDNVFSSSDWEEEKLIEKENARKRREEEELKDRTDQPHGTWEEVYRNAKRADRTKNELHERDDRELERTGQPLCIYEPFYGEGTWPFLHCTSLYRGIGLASLSKSAESALLESIQARRHGDTLYFWVRMDKDPRNPLNQDFWSFCDSINAGNCRFAVSEALRKMYGIRHDWESLPPMPADGDSWSVMHSWALPTRSFLEFVMFSRMFVDAMDAQMYDEHHQGGHCYLSLSKDRHCYSRVLELLVNVWAYHSARRMVYVNPETGAMHEHHKLKSRRGQMRVRWFSFTTLKSMDEDLAEEYDSDRPDRRWLWPLTGEVFWQGIYERERHLRHRQKEKRKQQTRDKISRIRKRTRQKTLGKYVKPLPEEAGNSNLTSATKSG